MVLTLSPAAYIGSVIYRETKKLTQEYQCNHKLFNRYGTWKEFSLLYGHLSHHDVFLITEDPLGMRNRQIRNTSSTKTYFSIEGEKKLSDFTTVWE